MKGDTRSLDYDHLVCVVLLCSPMQYRTLSQVSVGDALQLVRVFAKLRPTCLHDRASTIKVYDKGVVTQYSSAWDLG